MELLNGKTKNSKKRKREEKNEDLDSILAGNNQVKVISIPKEEVARKSILLDKNFWDCVASEKISEILQKEKKFSFGNYDRYYYKRYIEALKDPRLDIFNQEWFSNKKVLDIGCNDGTLTILVGVTYKPQQIEGIDIDYRLVMKAVKNMKYVLRSNMNKKVVESMNSLCIVEDTPQNNSENVNLIDEILQNDNNEKYRRRGLGQPQGEVTSIVHEEIKKRLESNMSNKPQLKELLYKLDSMPKSFLLSLGIPQKEIHKKEQLSAMKIDETKEIYSNNISFKQENYVQSLKQKENCPLYDTIMCMSTVKWIHLNYGDSGVKLLFHNVYTQLKDGGLFIFEPQNWKSYKKRKGLNERIKKNFAAITLRPEQFQSYLEDTYGFRCINKVIPPSNSKKSFDRPIFIFQKPQK